MGDLLLACREFSCCYVDQGGGVDLNRNLSITAGFYSQFAGVLAGFAFAGLIALLIAHVSAGSSTNHSMRSIPPLLSTFVALVGSSLAYANATGVEGKLPEIASAVQSSAAVGLSTATLMLLFSLTILVRGVERDRSQAADDTQRTSTFLKNTILGPVALLVMFNMVQSFDNHMVLKHGERDSWYYVTAVVILGIALILQLVIWLRHRDNRHQNPSVRPVNIVSALAVVFASLSLLVSSFLAGTDDGGSWQEDFVPFIEMILVVGFVNLASFVAARYEAGQVGSVP